MPEETTYQTMTDGDGTTWIEIANTANSDEAELIQGFLETEGIRAEIEHAEAKILPANFGKLGDVRVFVPAADQQRAMDLMRERQQQYDDSIDDDGETLVTDEGVAAIDENSEPQKD